MKKEKEKRRFSLFRIGDLFILLIVLCLVGAVLYSVFAPARGNAAEVYSDGKLIATLSLKKNTVYELDHMQIVVNGGKVWVEHADCPDKICEKTGKIYKKGQAIVCLPNKIAIRITGKGEVEAIV